MNEQQENRRLFLVHWHAQEAEKLASALRDNGWLVALEHGAHEVKLKDLRQAPPRAVVISLRRLPSHGREIAGALWSVKWAREIPLVFFDGDEDVVEGIRAKFVSALFTTWDRLPALLESLGR